MTTEQSDQPERRRFIACPACLGWGRVDTHEPGGWRRTGPCPECNGSGEERGNDGQAEAA